LPLPRLNAPNCGMARTTAQIETDLAALRAARLAILRGGAVKQFAEGSTSWTHASLGELNEAERNLLYELDTASDATQGAIILADLRQVP